jgi:hypothetical protein
MSLIKRILSATAATVLFALLMAAAPDITEQERAAEHARIEKLAAEILPEVAETAGFELGEPVKIVIITRAEVRDFLVKLLDETYPGDELERQSRTYAAFGLLPKDYDLRQGLLDLLHEQAGAFYDPRTKAFNSIIDLPEELKIPMVERVLVAHELTHALQDRVFDLQKMMEESSVDVDRGYAQSSVMEGMASVTMFVAGQGMQLKSLPDLGGLMRMSMGAAGSNPIMKVFAASPKYLQETLISPYAEGASFMQAFLKANPDEKMSAILARMPESGEQILHYDKYAEGDEPTVIDLSAVGAALPASWTPYYDNTLGEFDIRVLCQLNEQTTKEAKEIAAGWDGIHFVSFTDGEDDLLVLGTSIWDSEDDAAEFAAGLETVLSAVHDESDFTVQFVGERVNFVIGRLSHESLQAALEALTMAPVSSGGQF